MTFLHHEPCPKCGSRDNLARYTNGSGWCFGCHYYERGDRSPFVSNSLQELTEESIKLSDDLCTDFPEHIVTWLAKYGISVEEAIKGNIKYSPSYDQLTFLFKDENNRVLFTQARNFNPERLAKRKYYNSGTPKDLLPIFHCPNPTRRLVLTEDALSSLKIARQCDAMPCLGTYLPARKINALRALNYETLYVWLDSDKLKEAREISDMCKWIGIGSKTIYTEKDPKEYSNEEIAELIK